MNAVMSATKAPVSLTLPFSMIPQKPVHWYFKGFIPFRHVTLVLGPAGMSKGINVLDLCARMTRHDPAPGESKPSYGGPRDIIVVLPEDDPNESVAGRLAGAGAVIDRVHNLTTFPDGRWFTVPTDVKSIPQAIAEIEFDLDDQGKRTIPRYAEDGKRRKVGMVILDPLLALAENDLRTRGQARPMLEELESLARDRHLVILLTHHVNANGQAASSRAIVETVRNVVTLGMPEGVPQDSPLRVMTVSKTNIGRTGQQAAYALTGTLEEPHVVWEADMPADDLASAAAHRGYEVGPVAPLAPPTLPQQAFKLGCKHTLTKFGTPDQCPGCPAAKLLPPVSAPPLVKLPAKGGILDRRKWNRTAA